KMQQVKKAGKKTPQSLVPRCMSKTHRRRQPDQTVPITVMRKFVSCNGVMETECFRAPHLPSHVRTSVRTPDLKVVTSGEVGTLPVRIPAAVPAAETAR